MADYPIPVQTLESYCVQPETDTKDFFFHHVNYRIKDPQATLRIYSEMLGMRLIHVIEIEHMKTSLYFMGYCDGEIPKDQAARMEYMLARRSGLIEFMYHWGSEKEADVHYASGNSVPGKGYSHIAIRCPDAQAAGERLLKKGVKFIKRQDEGKVQGFGYFLDPDGYWVEILGDRVFPAPDPVTAQDPEEFTRSYNF